MKIWQEKLLKEISLRLRHSFASLTNAVGISQFNASKMLGHSTTATPSKIYTHMYDISHEEEMKRIEEALKENSKPALE